MRKRSSPKSRRSQSVVNLRKNAKKMADTTKKAIEAQRNPEAEIHKTETDILRARKAVLQPAPAARGF